MRHTSGLVIYIGSAPDPIMSLNLVVKPSPVSFMDVAQAPFASLMGCFLSFRDCLAIPVTRKLLPPSPR
jgi:hypothetical protein